LPKCTSCGENAMIISHFCTNCGVDLKSQKWVSTYKLCEKCKNPIEPGWKNCSICGNQLIQKVETVKICQFCKKNVDTSWLMCPYCGSKLKIIAGL
jgi:RNA polymerase subunit RPABC4/transcription elongation factor Spt4